MASTASKIAALERLAADPAAAPGERRNALDAARKLRAKLPSAPDDAGDPWNRIADELRRAARAWHDAAADSDTSPVHGRRCTGAPSYAGGPGCADCARILAWRLRRGMRG